MGWNVALIAAAALLAGLGGIAPPSRADTRPLPPGLARVLADGAGRAVGRDRSELSPCAWARDFVRRYGRARAVEIARLKHSDAEIEAWRRACFPDADPIARRPGDR